MEQLTVDELMKTSISFRMALVLSKDMTLEELVSEAEKVTYKAFGFEAIQLIRMKDNGYWSVGLRNPEDWDKPQLDCRGTSMKEALQLFYAWSIHKEYITSQPAEGEVISIRQQVLWWIEDGNVISFEDGYATQDAGWANRIADPHGLYIYFLKEIHNK